MKRRIFRGMILLTGISLILISAVLCVVFYHRLSSTLSETLQNRAETFVDNASQTAIEALAITQSSDMRVTVVSPDGIVVFDNAAEAETMPNHLDRAEIADALEYGFGQSVRFSDTLQKETVYYAVRLTDGYVLRVSKTSSSIFGIFLGMLPIVGGVVLISVIVCYVLAGRLTRKIIKPLNTVNLNEPLFAPYDELAPFIKTISEQREQLTQQVSEKAKAEKLRREFSANVSHELKTPLTSLYGHIELLAGGMVREEDRDSFYVQIQKEAGRLIALIEDILMLSKLDESTGAESFEAVNLADIAAEAVTALSQKAEKTNVTVQLSAERATMLGNRSLLYEMLYNLIDNAIKYNKPGGTVKVALRKTDNRLNLSVSDTGIGIPKESQARVFERFYRVDKSRSKKTGGTGLGLAIAKHIVLVHDGKIELKSRENEGTTLTITFVLY